MAIPRQQSCSKLFLKVNFFIRNEADGTLQKSYVPGYVKTGACKAEGKCKVYLAAIHRHCHVPTHICLNNDIGELLCWVEPVYGGTGGFLRTVTWRLTSPALLRTRRACSR